MKVRAFVLAAGLLASVSLSAQDNETKETTTYANVTEFGFMTASPKGVALEATTAHGIAFNKKHLLGLGVGIGGSFSPYYNTAYMPIFINYRLYFKPNSTFSPHLNAALGGVMLENGAGMYSAVTMGFRAGHFSFSSGLSFMPMQRMGHFRFYDDPMTVWYYPFGITIKVGFSF